MRYARCVDLLDDLHAGLADGSYPRRLIRKDLIAFDGTRFQVLSLPNAPVMQARPRLVTEDDFEEHDPATVNSVIRSSLDRRR